MATRSRKGPTEEQLAATLGAARAVWDAITGAIAARHRPLAQEWKPSKSAFGWVCLLKAKERTLLYLTPEEGQVLVAVVLGERAVAIALADDLPAEITKLIGDARRYAEGRGIRFPVRTLEEVRTVVTLVDAKTSKA